jgi:Ala-tRNA(Pro) deacylase
MPYEKLIEYLQSHGVEYRIVRQASPFVGREAGCSLTRTVVVKLDGRLAMAAMPAEDRLNFNLLREAAGAATISLALEDELAALFPSCEQGAMPPLGQLFGMPLYADNHLVEAASISFNGGRHDEVVTLSCADFLRLERPRIARFTFRPLQEFRAW